MTRKIVQVIHIAEADDTITLCEEDDIGNMIQVLKTWKIKDGKHTWSERYAQQFEVEEVKKE